tara:strand:- start:842 stop:1708 length:867 start_codon:yes stop_codon:yes gene_type:complete
MLTIDDLYCHKLCFVDEERAEQLQFHISYLYRNFNRPCAGVDAATQALRSVFFEALGCTATNEVRRMIGFIPTRSAFSIPPEEDLPSSPDDTRIAMMIGKPIATMNKQGTWEVALRKHYVVAMRVVDRSSVHLTKIVPTFTRTLHYHSIGRPMRREVLEEGQATRASASCCTDVVEAGQQIADVVIGQTKEYVDSLVDEASTRFKSFVAVVKSSLGESLQTPQLTLEIKRMHSRSDESARPLSSLLLIPRRCDTELVEEITSGMKEILGEMLPTSRPPEVTREKRVSP